MTYLQAIADIKDWFEKHQNVHVGYEALICAIIKRTERNSNIDLDALVPGYYYNPRNRVSKEINGLSIKDLTSKDFETYLVAQNPIDATKVSYYYGWKTSLEGNGR